jgi:hypothetical protein
VFLKELEVLNIALDAFWIREQEEPLAEAGRLLRLLAPGPRPLRFTLQTVRYIQDRSFEEVNNFFMRSKVVRFCSQNAWLRLAELSSYARNLETLVFYYCVQREGIIDLITRANQDSPIATASQFHWKSWCMISCQIILQDLSTIVHSHPIRKLVLVDYTVYKETPASIAEDDGLKVPHGESEAMFPSVRFIEAREVRDLPDLSEN